MRSVQAGDEIVVEAEQLVAGGAALARIEGFPIFIANIFPGDVALVRLEEVKKGFARASLLVLQRPSPLRRIAPCPIAGDCGGCDWTALQLDHQLRAKERILSESLRRIGKLDPQALPPIRIHPSPLNYRLRSRLQRQDDVAGFFALRSNRVVPLVKECEVVGVETARRFGDRRFPPGEGSLSLWEVHGDVIEGDTELVLRVLQYCFRLSTRSFFQVNRHLLGTMLALVHQTASRVEHRDRAVDLYAGVGFFTAPLATLFGRVTAVEGAAESARYARANAAPNVEVIEASVEQQVPRLPRASLYFLDPPRAGARREVIAAVAGKAEEMILYLSCDPVTFARDANRLTASEWKLTSLDLLDLFPNTHHIETLGVFQRLRRGDPHRGTTV